MQAPLRSLLYLGLAAALFACEQKPAATTPAPELATDDDKTIYALGLVLARNVGDFHLSEAELGVLEQGLRDGVLGREPRVALEEWGPKVGQLVRARAASGAAEEARAGAAFVDAAAAEPGAEKTASGLVYRELVAGAGASPTPSNFVKVHYRGTLRDGSVFDSSIDRGEPAEFPLNRVIPCWTEALQKMKVGGKAKITCPASLAYGDRGAPPKIKPGAVLAFEVELLDVSAAALPPGHPELGKADAGKAAAH
jgi:FKBP-type peptidyl-prolyl cis-trans isomerase